MLDAIAQTTYSYSSNTTEDPSGALIAVILVFLVLLLGLSVLAYVALWKIFKKANRPGWASLVPYHNIVLILEMASKPGWWVLVMLAGLIPLSIPFINLLLVFPVCIAFLVFGIIIAIDFAKAFGKGPGMGVLLVLFPYVGLPILAFGDAEYIGPKYMTTIPHETAPHKKV
jgi:hypothetical protein